MRDAATGEQRLAELRALAEDTEGMEPGAEDAWRGERERLRHVGDLATGAAAAVQAIAPEDGDGAAAFIAHAERAVGPLEPLAPELQAVGDELRETELRLREAATELHRFLATLEAEPGRLEHVESELDRSAAAKRRYGCTTYEELLARAEEARAELAALDAGADPVAAAAAAVEHAQARFDVLAAELRAARAKAAPAFAADVAEELRELGMGDGEFAAEPGEAPPGPTGADDVRFLVRPNPGLPIAPVAETASGGELSRIALAIAAVAGGETLVFDEIDAGIGGETASAVGRSLSRLAERAQVVTITHLPQIATRADRHFRVEKVAGDPTVTTIAALTDDERHQEVERMLGGQEFLAALGSGKSG